MVFHSGIGAFTESLSLSYSGGRASHKEAGPPGLRPGLSHPGQASHTECWPLTQRGCASQKEAGTLIKRLGGFSPKQRK